MKETAALQLIFTLGNSHDGESVRVPRGFLKEEKKKGRIRKLNFPFFHLGLFSPSKKGGRN